MFSTSSLYFLVSIFGESIETSESGHNEKQVETREIHNESGESPERHLQGEQAVEQNTNQSKPKVKETEDTLHQETSENQRRVLELPLSITAGIGYAVIGLWMILDRRNSKIPYIIAIIGSLILLGIYASSRTIGISTLGIEPVGLFDAIVAGLQVIIIATSLYILITKIYPKGKTVGR